MTYFLLTFALIICSVSVTVVVMSLVFVSKNSKRNLKNIMGEALKIYGLPSAMSESLKPFLPEKYNNVADEVFKAAEKAVLDTSGETENRKEHIKTLVLTDLKNSGTEKDNTLEELVNIAVSSLLLALKSRKI